MHESSVVMFILSLDGRAEFFCELSSVCVLSINVHDDLRSDDSCLQYRENPGFRLSVPVQLINLSS